MNRLAAPTQNALATRIQTQPTLFLPDAATAERFMGFFAAHIRNPNTRRAYYRAICAFSTWCEVNGIHTLTDVRPLHVAAYIEQLAFAKPTIKQHLAAIRMVFDWLVVGNVMTSNPAHSVRGPRYVVTKGRTPILEHDEARTLLRDR